VIRRARMLDSQSADRARLTPSRSRRYAVGGTKAEQWFARCISQRIAGIAAADAGVLGSRRMMWGSPEPLSPEAARAMLNSPALRIMRKDELEAHGIPLVGHVATLERLRPAGDGWCKAKLRAVWPGGEHAETRRVREIHLAWAEEPRQWLKALELPGSEEVQFLGWDEGGRGQAVPVEPGSVLYALRVWAKEFTDLRPYLAWRLCPFGAEASAITFLLAGTAPVISAIVVRREIPGLGADTITVEALVECETASVAAAFEKMKQAALGHHPQRRLMALRTVQRIYGQDSIPKGQVKPFWRSWQRNTPKELHFPSWKTLWRDLRDAGKPRRKPRA